ncbi:MAG: DNA-binding response regulator [Limnochordales bacterium]|nr:DNA-binding response regulator [Limnochordales bacterium]
MTGSKALVIYSSEGNLAPLVEGIKRGLEKGGWNVEVVAASRSDARPIPGGYDLVCVGSPSYGFWRGRAAEDIEPTLKRCRRLEGVSAAAFVTPRAFASQMALRQVMAMLEREGAFVRDFATIANVKQAEEFGNRLASLR